VIESPSGSIDIVPPSGGFANVGKSDETGESGMPVAVEDADELKFGSSKVRGGGGNGMWKF